MLHFVCISDCGIMSVFTFRACNTVGYVTRQNSGVPVQWRVNQVSFTSFVCPGHLVRLVVWYQRRTQPGLSSERGCVGLSLCLCDCCWKGHGYNKMKTIPIYDKGQSVKLNSIWPKTSILLGAWIPQLCFVKKVTRIAVRFKFDHLHQNTREWRRCCVLLVTLIWRCKDFVDLSPSQM